ncbi:fibronectin type III domain-containing protein [Streptomyces sp. NPDC004059]
MPFVWPYRARASRGVLVIGLIVGLLVGLSTSASAADTATPTLVSFSVSDSHVTPGSLFTVSYAADDDSGQLHDVIFQFTDPLGGQQQIRTSGNPLPLTGTIQQRIPANWPNGTYKLSYVYLYDPTGNGITYTRDGGIYKSPSGASGPTSHALDFSTADFTVTGSSADTATPTLVSFSVSDSHVTPGSLFTVSYAADDDSGQLHDVIFQFTDPLGGQQQIRTSGNPLSLTGTIQQRIPANWPNGTYKLSYVYLYDPTGNGITYTRDGGIYKSPSGASGPTSHAHDFSTADFTVATVPDAPTKVTASAGNRRAVVSWSPSASNGALVTGYTVTAEPGGATAATSGATSATMAGLNNGTSYTFTVTATNWVGTSAASAPSAPVTPAPQAPAAPSAVSASPGDTQASVAWTAPSDDGGSPVTGYTVTANPGGTTVTTTGATSAVVPGLKNGTAYTFTVTATSAAGVSAASSPSKAVIPCGVPAAPGEVTAAAGNHSAQVSWAASPANGSPIISYRITVSPGGRTVTVDGSSTTATVTGLSNATPYTFTVTAINAVGEGPASATSNTVTPNDPVKPTVTIAAGPSPVTSSTSARFTFTASDSTDETSSLTYVCSLDTGPYTACTSPRSYSGLASTVHTFAVKAIDPSGNESTPAKNTWRVDTTQPAITLGSPASAFSLSTTLTAAWSAKDTGAGVANADVRWQRASSSGGFSSWTYPSAWQKTTAASVKLTGAARGYTYCFSARARDKAGNQSAWSAPRCTAVVMDDRSLTASKGWTRTTSSAYYAGTATTTSKAKETLTRADVQTKRIALIATRCPSCGSVAVYWNGSLIKTISLRATTTQRQAVLNVTAFTGIKSGKLTLRTQDTRSVQIDGVGLSRS